MAYSQQHSVAFNRVFALTWLAYVAFNIARKSVSVSKHRLQSEVGLTEFELGLIDTSFLLAYTLGQFVTGPLSDVVGSRLIIGMGLMCSAVAQLCSSTVSSARALVILSFLHGAAQSGAHASCVKVLGHWIPDAERGFQMGVWSTCSSVGGILGTALATVFLTSSGWRACFQFSAPILFFVGSLCLCFIIEKPRDVGIFEKSYTKNKSPAKQKVKSTVTLFAILKLPGLSSIAACYFLLKYVRYVLLLWLPYYHRVNQQFDEATAGYLSMSFEVGGILGALAIGWVSDRYMSGRRTLASFYLLVAATIILIVYGLVSSYSIYFSGGMMALIGVCLLGPDSVLAGAVCQDIGCRTDHANIIGSITGVINGFGSMGSILQGLVTPLISMNAGWNFVFVVLTTAIALSTLTILPAVLVDSGDKAISTVIESGEKAIPLKRSKTILSVIVTTLTILNGVYGITKVSTFDRSSDSETSSQILGSVGSNKCNAQVWLDVDNVLADPRNRIAAHTTNNKLRNDFQLPHEVMKDPLVPHSTKVVNRFFWLGCTVNVITARGQWPKAEETTNTWLQHHGFLYHNLTTTDSAQAKVPILLNACKKESPCIFIDDLRTGWHLDPVGNNTSLYHELVEIYSENPHIELELFHQPGDHSWIDIERKYFVGKAALSFMGSPLMSRPTVFAEGTRSVLMSHINRSSVFTKSSNDFNLLWILKQNPKYEAKTLYQQLGVRRTIKSLPWARMLQKIQLPVNQMINSIPGVIETFGTKSLMYKNARERLSLKSFNLPGERDLLMAATKGRKSSMLWVYKPDNESNGKGIRLGDARTILRGENGGNGVVQEFISSPLLTKDNRKVDFRIYVLISSMDTDPPRAYINRHGYVRVAGTNFSRSADIGSQILNSKRTPSTRMTTREFWQDHYPGANADLVKANIETSIAMVLGVLSAHIGCKSKHYYYDCNEIRFQLLGVDVGIDQSGEAHVFEIGFDPSLKRRRGPTAKEINANDDQMYNDIFAIMHASMHADVGTSHGATEASRAEAERRVLGTFKPLLFKI